MWCCRDVQRDSQARTGEKPGGGTRSGHGGGEVKDSSRSGYDHWVIVDSGGHQVL